MCARVYSGFPVFPLAAIFLTGSFYTILIIIDRQRSLVSEIDCNLKPAITVRNYQLDVIESHAPNLILNSELSKVLCLTTIMMMMMMMMAVVVTNSRLAYRRFQPT